MASESRDLGNLLRCQLELGKPGQVALESLHLVARCERNDVLVNHPSQTDLRLCDTILLGQLGVETVDGTALGRHERGEGAVGGHSNVMLLVEGNEIAVLEIGVVLDLVDGGLDLGRLEDGFEVHLQEVGHADGLDTARLLELLELSPALLQVLVGLGEPGTMDQIQIDVVEAELLKGDVKRVNRGTLLLSGDLGGDKELLSGNATLLDGLTKLLLVAVNWSLSALFSIDLQLN